MKRIRIRKDSHHFDNLDPHPDPHPYQIKNRIWIRIWICITIYKPEPDLDPHQCEKTDPGPHLDLHQIKNLNLNPHQGDKSNPDPHQSEADPQHGKKCGSITF